MKIISRALLAVACLFVLAGEGDADEVIVGAQFPLSGPMASYSGPFLKSGAEIAAQRIKEQLLLGKDRTLKLLIEDNAGDRNQAISLMNRFATADNVLAVLGVYGSFLSLPVAPVANELKTPLLAIAVSPAIAQAGPWSFTLLEQPKYSMEPLAALAADWLKVRKIAVVYDRANDASVRLKDLFTELVKARNVEILSSDGITAQDTNFAPLATKIVSEPIDALFVESVPSVMANFIVQVRQAGLPPDVKLLSSGQASSPAFFDIAGKAADGLYFTADYASGLDNQENKYLVEAYRKQTGKAPDQNVAWAYAGLLLIAHAINDTGPNPDRGKVRDALAKLRNVPTALGEGNFSFDENRMPTYPDVVMQVVNGKPTLVK
jgi:branched-chain amino acid transport system substrate-binding protein